jgi:hypothetical protein
MDIFDDDKGPIKVMKSKALDRKEIARLQGIDFNDYKEKGRFGGVFKQLFEPTLPMTQNFFYYRATQPAANDDPIVEISRVIRWIIVKIKASCLRREILERC